MALVACLVVGVTLVAPHVGPGVSGVLASFPFMAAILPIFAHRLIDPEAAQQVMRGMVAGLSGVAVFFCVLSLMLTRSSLLAAYVSATVGALAVQAACSRQVRQPMARSVE